MCELRAQSARRCGGSACDTPLYGTSHLMFRVIRASVVFLPRNPTSRLEGGSITCRPLMTRCGKYAVRRESRYHRRSRKFSTGSLHVGPPYAETGSDETAGLPKIRS